MFPSLCKIIYKAEIDNGCTTISFYIAKQLQISVLSKFYERKKFPVSTLVYTSTLFICKTVSRFDSRVDFTVDL